MSRRSVISVTKTVVKQFQQDLEERKDVSFLRQTLSTASKNEIVEWTDDNGLNILHFCILNDHAEAADLLLKQGYFASPSEPAVSPYMHLAALLGYKTVLTVLIQHRPDDFQVTSSRLFVPVHLARRLIRPLASVKWISSDEYKRFSSFDSSQSTYSPRLAMKRMSLQTGSLSCAPISLRKRSSVYGDICIDGSRPLLKTPLELAARAWKLQCVKLLLDMCVSKKHPGVPCKGYFTLATLADCPSALLLLFMYSIKSDNRQIDDMKFAIKLSLQNVQPMTLDVLLNNLPSYQVFTNIFKNINFYHVLYSLSASYEKQVCSRLPEVTRVLIRRGHDVNTKLPPRTYPMYSLLTHAFCYHDHTFEECYRECLELLLKEGANPNFDEVEFEMQLQKNQGVKFSAGREAFPSGLACLLETMETESAHISREARHYIVQEFATVLVKYGADPCKVGKICGVPADSLRLSKLQGHILHQFAKSVVALGLNIPVFRCLVRLGAEPGLKVQDRYPINVYFDKLFEVQENQKGSSDTELTCRHQEDVNKVLALFTHFMTPVNIKEAAFVLRKTYIRTKCEQVRSCLMSVLADLEARSCQVWTLRSLTAWRLWYLCSKHADTVRRLPIMEDLKALIVPYN